jgi:hypothetical protein
LGRRLDFTYSSCQRLSSVTDGTRTFCFGQDANLRLSAYTNALDQVTLYKGPSVTSLQLTRFAFSTPLIVKRSPTARPSPTPSLLRSTT